MKGFRRLIFLWKRRQRVVQKQLRLTELKPVRTVRAAALKKVVGTCSVCGGDIIEGDSIFQVTDDKAIHADCVQGFTPEEVFSLMNISPSQTFRNSDIDGSTFLEMFGIQKECA